MSEQEFFDFLQSCRFCDPNELKGCSAQEIGTLETKYGISLPSAYKTILTIIGKGAGSLIDTSEYEFYYDSILNLTSETNAERNEVKEEENIEITDLPANAFFIVGRYREQFHFILGNSGNDSEVYYYNFERDEYIKDYDSIWQWILAFLMDNEWGAIMKGE